MHPSCLSPRPHSQPICPSPALPRLRQIEVMDPSRRQYQKSGTHIQIPIPFNFRRTTRSHPQSHGFVLGYIHQGIIWSQTSFISCILRLTGHCRGGTVPYKLDTPLSFPLKLHGLILRISTIQLCGRIEGLALTAWQKLGDPTIRAQSCT